MGNRVLTQLEYKTNVVLFEGVIFYFLFQTSNTKRSEFGETGGLQAARATAQDAIGGRR